MQVRTPRGRPGAPDDGGGYDGSASTGSGIVGPAPVDFNGDDVLEFGYYSGDRWYFYNPNGSLNKSFTTGGVAGDLASHAGGCTRNTTERKSRPEIRGGSFCCLPEAQRSGMQISTWM